MGSERGGERRGGGEGEERGEGKGGGRNIRAKKLLLSFVLLNFSVA